MSHVFKSFPILHTPNMTLRQLNITDEPAIYELYSDPTVSSARERMPFEVPEESSIMIKQINDNYRKQTRIRWAIESRETGKLMGTIGIRSSVPISAHGEAYMNFELGRDYRGQGFMSEALKVVIEFSLDVIQLHKLSADFFSQNIAIPHLLKKVGFVIDYKEMRYSAAINSEVEYTVYSRVNPNIH